MYKYSHGGNAAFEPGCQDVLDLSANINPLCFPEGIKEAIIDAIPLILEYPDSLSRELRNEIALLEGVPPDWIFCGSGASDIIFRLCAYKKPRAAVLPAPTFSDYERALSVYGSRVYYHYLSEKDGFIIDGGIVDSALKKGTGNVEMVFICNPNNPTGVLTDLSVIENILSWCAETGALAAIDECFMGFVEHSCKYTALPLLEKYNNLIILKAFTKIFALPGIRLGDAVCSSNEIIEGLYKSGPDWPVSAPARAAGGAAVQSALNGDYLRRTVAFVARERELMGRELENLGFTVFKGSANYIFFKNNRGRLLREKLEKSGIRLRNCGNYVGLTEDYWRVAVSTACNNKRFIEAVKAF